MGRAAGQTTLILFDSGQIWWDGCMPHLFCFGHFSCMFIKSRLAVDCLCCSVVISTNRFCFHLYFHVFTVFYLTSVISWVCVAAWFLGLLCSFAIVCCSSLLKTLSWNLYRNNYRNMLECEISSEQICCFLGYLKSLNRQRNHQEDYLYEHLLVKRYNNRWEWWDHKSTSGSAHINTR